MAASPWHAEPASGTGPAARGCRAPPAGRQAHNQAAAAEAEAKAKAKAQKPGRPRLAEPRPPTEARRSGGRARGPQSSALGTPAKSPGAATGELVRVETRNADTGTARPAGAQTRPSGPGAWGARRASSGPWELGDGGWGVGVCGGGLGTCFRGRDGQVQMARLPSCLCQAKCLGS